MRIYRSPPNLENNLTLFHVESNTIVRIGPNEFTAVSSLTRHCYKKLADNLNKPYEEIKDSVLDQFRRLLRNEIAYSDGWMLYIGTDDTDFLKENKNKELVKKGISPELENILKKGEVTLFHRDFNIRVYIAPNKYTKLSDLIRDCISLIPKEYQKDHLEKSRYQSNFPRLLLGQADSYLNWIVEKEELKPEELFFNNTETISPVNFFDGWLKKYILPEFYQKWCEFLKKNAPSPFTIKSFTNIEEERQNEINGFLKVKSRKDMIHFLKDSNSFYHRTPKRGRTVMWIIFSSFYKKQFATK